MAETAKLGLPLLEGAQAQKHVTVNEALARIDALAAPAVVSRTLTTPPAGAPDGAVYVPAAGAGGVWAGRAGQLALADNGGWSFAEPSAGQRVWLAGEGREAIHDGTGFVTAQGATAGGAGTAFALASLDHAVAAGAASVTATAIPDKAVVIGVTARVLAPLASAGVTWRLGVAADTGRYGSGYGAQAGAFALGLTGGPLAYYADTPLVLSAEGGAFTGGLVRLCVHFLSLVPPRAV